ncbi:MAG: ArsR family transcriptional regulator [Methanomicrobiales archaeon]|nr:ArsR family transcriptional regulator [Methanomicrobiales archaeon]
MKSKNIQYFTEREEEFADLLMRIGINRNVSKVLVYLAKTPCATSRDIERGTDLRQPEVSIVMTTMMERKWIESRDEKTEYKIGQKAEHKGRPVKIYTFALPICEVVDSIERETMARINEQLKMVTQLRTYITE